MSKSESLTQKWLRQNLQPYPQGDIVYAHADAVLLQHPTIRPKTDVYTYDDGRTQILLCLHGLLPIAFRGASYHIPIAIWIQRDYPRSPPLAYVVPTSDMLVRASPNLEVSGRCQIQYVRDWQRKSEGCNLVALLEAMQDVFSREPPVYAKPKDANVPSTQSTRPPTPSATDYAHRAPPPLPVDRTVSADTVAQPVHHSVETHSSSPPPLPAKPGASIATASPPVQARSTSVPLPQASADIRGQSTATFSFPVLAMRPPPPLPQVTVPIQSSDSPVPPSYLLHQHNTSDLSSNVPPWPARTVSSPTSQARSDTSYQAIVQTPSPPQPLSFPPAISATIPGATPSVGYAATAQHVYPTPVGIIHPGQGQSQPPPPPFSAPQPVFGAAVIRSYDTSPISHAPPPPPFPQAFSPPSAPSVPAPDLLDADDDENTVGPSISPPPATAPPRPPNPELLRLHDQVHAKISSELASLSQAMAVDAERLRANQTDLLAGEPAIHDEMARLEAVRDVCRGVSARLEGVVAAGERNVAELKRKGDPEVDEMICSTTIVYNQLINLVAEDNAIEDTIYHLHRALNAGRVDLERFLRTTRVLAEEQFMKRALIEKIQTGISLGATGAGWPAPSRWR